jgi:ABC-2 type transport system ATP-binding protein
MTVALAPAPFPSPEASAPVAVVDQIAKRYGRIVAVDDVSFAVVGGETFGLLGPNGAGKTSTLEMMEGLRLPDSGGISLLGTDAVRHRSAVQERIGVQLQSQALWAELTVEETLKTFAALFRHTVPIEGLLDRFSLAEKRHALVKNLSGGQKQRLSVATALVNAPEIVFLDEPTTGLDPQARHSFWDVIRSLRADGTTVILTTHYMEEAEALCDRVAIMDHGRLIALDTPRGLVRGLAFENAIECTFQASVAPEILAAIPCVHQVASESGSFVLFTDDLAAVMAELMQVTDSGGKRAQTIQVRSATLEDVFISLTGRRLRD